MSRIGKKPVQIPAGVTVTVNGNNVHVKGPKGELERTFSELVTIKQEGEEIIVATAEESRDANAQHGLVRTLINNMVIGVTEGYVKTLELQGVGYRASLKGKTLEMTLGFSHPVTLEPPEGIEFECPETTIIHVKGIDKQLVGQTAADVRAFRPPEPYKGKGVRYQGEHIRRKEGKAGA